MPFWQVPPLFTLATTLGTKTRGEVKGKWVYYLFLILTFPSLPPSKERALTWGLLGWQRDAYIRTEEFRNHGPRAPMTWVLVDGRDKIPKSAIEAGKDKDGHPIYIARAYYENSIRTFDQLMGYWCLNPLMYLFVCLFRNWQSLSRVQDRCSHRL